LTGRYKLRFDLQERTNGTWYYAEYSSFVVLSEAYNYRLQVSGYSGNVGVDALRYSYGMEFTTYDRDNDLWIHSQYKNNCAVYNGGGCWFRSCHCYFNNVHGRGDGFKWWSSRLQLQSSRMWLTC